jgi:tetratricopeptide (TPR) repeat protein
MHGDYRELGLSPAQEATARTVVERARNVASDRRGRLIFIGGKSGSGKSHLLHGIAGRLEADSKDFLVATGQVEDSRRSGLDEARHRRAEALLTGAAGAASAAAALDPSLSLIGPIANFSVAAASLIQGAGEIGAEPTPLAIRMLRAAARETHAKVLVALIDDADCLNGLWWTELQFSFANELLGLPILLVLAVEADPDLELDSEKSPAQRVAASLERRRLAEIVPLRPLSRPELTIWLAHAPRTAVTAASELTQGLIGDIAELWRDWLDLGVLAPSGDRKWHLTKKEGLVDDALGQLVAHIERALPDATPDQMELARGALGFGALEGRVFTATAVAAALGRDPEEVEDLLDELAVEPPNRGLLNPPRILDVLDPVRGERRALWRYEFTSRLIWKAARGRLLDGPPREHAKRLLEVLADLYVQATPALAITMARLADQADEPAIASHYKELIVKPALAVLAAQARYLLIADTSDWGPSDHRDAAYLLSETVLGLSDTHSARDLHALAEHAVAHAQRAGSSSGQPLAVALRAEARLLFRQADLDGAIDRLEQARELVADGAPETRAGLSLELYEVLAARRDDQEGRRRLIEEAMQLFHGTRNRSGEAACKYHLSQVAYHAKEHDRARSLNEEALSLTRAHGDRRQEMATLHQRAIIEHEAGNNEEAREFVKEALRYQIAIGRTFGEAVCLRLLASIELDLGNAVNARRNAAEALDLYTQLDDREHEASALFTLGIACCALGESEQGLQFLLRSREGFQRAGADYYVDVVDDRIREVTGSDPQ